MDENKYFKYNSTITYKRVEAIFQWNGPKSNMQAHKTTTNDQTTNKMKIRQVLHLFRATLSALRDI